MSLDSFLNVLVTIEKPVRTKDASGGVAPTSWEPVDGFENVPTSIQPLSAKERMLFAQRQILMTHRLFFAQDPLLRRDFRITVDDHPTQHFRVLSYRNMAGRDTVWEVDALEQTD